jgi:glutaredoxin-like YruB-family protein
MHKLAVALLFTLVAVVAHAGVYKWTDANGKVHFSDKPPATEKVEEIKIPSFSGPAEVADVPAAAGGTVTMYSTAWCGVCKQARAYMQQKGIAFTEYDVEKDPTGKADFAKLGGRGVPVILVGGKRMNGFSPNRFDQLLRDAGY